MTASTSSSSRRSRASRSRARTRACSPRPRPPTRAASGSCSVASGVTADQVDRVYLAGGFANAVNVAERDRDRPARAGPGRSRGPRRQRRAAWRRRPAALEEPSRRPRRAGRADRARRAGDRGRLLRVVRRRLPVRAHRRLTRRPLPPWRIARCPSRHPCRSSSSARTSTRAGSSAATAAGSPRPPSGQPAVRVPLEDGEALLPVPPVIQDTREFQSGRVKHVMAAVLEGMANGPDAAIATAYVRWMAARQIAGGAAYLDINVDEVSPDVDGRLEAMAWLVRAVGPVSSVPLSIDSSDSSVMTVGLELLDPALGRRRATDAELGGGRPRRCPRDGGRSGLARSSCPRPGRRCRPAPRSGWSARWS